MKYCPLDTTSSGPNSPIKVDYPPALAEPFANESAVKLLGEIELMLTLPLPSELLMLALIFNLISCVVEVGILLIAFAKVDNAFAAVLTAPLADDAEPPKEEAASARLETGATAEPTLLAKPLAAPARVDTSFAVDSTAEPVALALLAKLSKPPYAPLALEPILVNAVAIAFNTPETSLTSAPP